MITVINSKKIFQADPDTGENIGVHIYELVGASTDIAGTKEGFLEWVKQNDIPVNLPGAFGNGSTFYAIDTKKKFIFFNGQFYELPTQGGGESNNVVVTFSDDGEGNVVSDKTCSEILDNIMQANPITGYYLNSESGTVYVFDIVSASEYGVQFESCSSFRNSTYSVNHEVVTMFLNSDNTVDTDYMYYADNEKSVYYISQDSQGNIVSEDGELDTAIADQVRLYYNNQYYDFTSGDGEFYSYRSVSFATYPRSTMTVRDLGWDTRDNTIFYQESVFQLTPNSPN